MTEIISNGSKWAGESPDTIEHLLAVLAKHPLDRRFGDKGFITRPTVEHDRQVRFFGNFLTVSHVFQIYSDEPDVIAKLTAAIEANQKRPDYRSQPKPKRAKAV